MQNITLFDISHMHEELPVGESFMSISEMIETLQNVQDRYGSDLNVGVLHRDGGGDYHSYGETYLMVDEDNKMILL